MSAVTRLTKDRLHSSEFRGADGKNMEENLNLFGLRRTCVAHLTPLRIHQTALVSPHNTHGMLYALSHVTFDSSIIWLVCVVDYSGICAAHTCYHFQKS